jgi:hypothetical protein
VRPVGLMTRRGALRFVGPPLYSRRMGERVRLLGKTGGYTTRRDRAMDPVEPEAVDAETQERITEAAARSWPGLRALQQGERSDRPLARRIQAAQQQARSSGVDVHPQLRLVRLAMEHGRPIEHIERRMEAVEARLWPTRT